MTVLITIANVWIILYASSQANSAENAVKTANDALNISSEFNRRSVNIADSTMRISLRAYVNIQSIHETQPLGVGVKGQIAVNVVNEGTTPAFRCNIRKKLKLAERIYQQEIDTFDNVPIEMEWTLGANIPFTLTWTDSAPLTKNDWTDIISHKKKYCIYGKITYLDKFGEAHFTLFAAYYLPESSTFSFYPKFNDAN